MGYSEAFDLALNNEMIGKKVQMAIVDAAIDVQAEPPATANHANRAALALAVLREPEKWTPLFARAVEINPVVQAAGALALDGDIKFAVASVWNAYAGVA